MGGGELDEAEGRVEGLGTEPGKPVLSVRAYPPGDMTLVMWKSTFLLNVCSQLLIFLH